MLYNGWMRLLTFTAHHFSTIELWCLEHEMKQKANEKRKKMIEKCRKPESKRHESRAITVAPNQRWCCSTSIETLTSVFLALFENEITTCLPTKRPLLDWKKPKNRREKNESKAKTIDTIKLNRVEREKRERERKNHEDTEKTDNENDVFSTHNICNYIHINTKSQSYWRKQR